MKGNAKRLCRHHGAPGKVAAPHSPGNSPKGTKWQTGASQGGGGHMPPQPGHKGDSAVRNYDDDDSGRDPDRMWSEGILSTHLPLKNPFPQSTCGKNLRQTPTEK